MRSDPAALPNREPQGKKKWVEPVTALLMALATLSTAWCAYQSAAFTRKSNRLMNEFNSLERRAGLQTMQGMQQATIHTAMFMQLLAAQQAGNENLVKFYAERVSHPTCARLTTHGWRRTPLKIRTPTRTLLCRTSTKYAEHTRPPRPTLRQQVACTQRATPAMFPVNTSRTLFCLPQCFSSPVPRENSSSAGCASLHSFLLWLCSRLRLFGRQCSQREMPHISPHNECAAGGALRFIC